MLCAQSLRGFCFFGAVHAEVGGEEDKRTRKAKEGKGNRKRDEEGKERKTQHYVCRASCCRCTASVRGLAVIVNIGAHAPCQ